MASCEVESWSDWEVVSVVRVLSMIPWTIERYEAASKYRPNDIAGLRVQKVICLKTFLRIFEKFAGCSEQQFNEMLREPHNPWWSDGEQNEKVEKWLGPSLLEAFMSIIHRINDALDDIGSPRQKTAGWMYYLLPERPRTSTEQQIDRFRKLNTDLKGLLDDIPTPDHPSSLDFIPQTLTEKSTCEPLVPPTAPPVPLMAPFVTPNIPFIVLEQTPVTLGRRERHLEDLDKILLERRDGAETIRAFLTGPPAIGKSEIALHYVHSRRTNFPGGVYWINAEDVVMNTVGIIITLRDKFGVDISATDGGRSKPEELLKSWLGKTKGWLVVVDGLAPDDDNILNAFIPQESGGSLIVTSRSMPSSTASFTRNIGIIPVRMTDEDSLDLFLRAFGAGGSDRSTKSEQETAQEIILQFLAAQSPPAILRAARYVQELARPLSEYARALSGLTVTRSATVVRSITLNVPTTIDISDTVESFATGDSPEDQDDIVSFVISVDSKDGGQREVSRTYDDFISLDYNLNSDWYQPLLQAKLGTDFCLFPQDDIELANNYLRGLMSVPLVCVSLPLQEFLAVDLPLLDNDIFPREAAGL
ncbi:MAG: hypothetical protein M1839_001259 [Geoglossum umbratile]|nr:MAG: hypothetical protein M1839_001259 [Geoglossum umbratile]